MFPNCTDVALILKREWINVVIGLGDWLTDWVGDRRKLGGKWELSGEWGWEMFQREQGSYKN